MRRTLRCLLALACSSLISPGFFGQSSESYQVHTSAFTPGGGERSSANFRLHDDSLGQTGFVSDQVFDFSPPFTPAVLDGLGVDLDRTTNNAQLCASWSGAADPQSGIFAHFAAIGTVPGSA